MTPHKHADLIKAWADGAQIELLSGETWHEVLAPSWSDLLTYRVKNKWQHILDAQAEGKVIQTRAKDSCLIWKDIPDARCNNSNLEYRVKPEKWQKEMDAFKAGAKIEYRPLNRGLDWVETVMPIWDEECEYRIQPERPAYKYQKEYDAFKNGEKIQVRDTPDGVWVDTVCFTINFSDALETEYRIKPETVKYRLVLLEFGALKPYVMAVHDEKDAERVQGKGFIRWVTDWIEIEV